MHMQSGQLQNEAERIMLPKAPRPYKAISVLFYIQWMFLSREEKHRKIQRHPCS
jgi:hypothetical protein